MHRSGKDGELEPALGGSHDLFASIASLKWRDCCWSSKIRGCDRKLLNFSYFLLQSVCFRVRCLGFFIFLTKPMWLGQAALTECSTVTQEPADA